MSKNLWREYYPSNPCKEKTIAWKSLVEFVAFLKTQDIGSGKAIDVGCGYGAESIYLEKKGFDVLGIDINSDAIQFAREIATREKVGAKFICEDVFEYLKHFKSNSLDIIVDSGLCESLRKLERKRHVQQLNRILKKGGWIYIKEFTNFDPFCQRYCAKRRWTFRKHLIEKIGFKYYYCYFFTKKELLSLFSQYEIHQFNTEKIDYHTLPYREFHVFFAQKL